MALAAHSFGAIRSAPGMLRYTTHLKQVDRIGTMGVGMPCKTG